ncbi:hypothetical protein N2W54_002789 [Lotmaria passim]
MSASHSCVDIMASRPQSTSLRKPLLHTSPPHTWPISDRHDATAQSPSSASAIADSPRRLLSYYLAKAAYNANGGDVTPTPQRDPPGIQHKESTEESQRTATLTQRDAHNRAAVEKSPTQLPAATLLRPPPLSRSAFSSGPRTTPASAQAAPTAPPSRSVMSQYNKSRKEEEEEEQLHRQFEEDILHQVEALLQAQRGESYAELEAYRLTAEEARTTLRVVEDALTEQLGSAAAAAVVPHLSSSPPIHPIRVSKDSSPPLDVDQLVLDMSRAAAAATPAATQELLDAIMSIQDGQDVPAVMLKVVRRLYDELTRVLVQPVMNFLQPLQCPQSRPHHGVRHGDPAFRPSLAGAESSSQDEALLQAHAKIEALQEEVAVLRRTLESRSTSHKESAQPHRALLDRFFTECHAMLTRSRQANLSLRRAVEEERRQHFLTRIRLLKPAPPSLPPLVPLKSQDGVSSPVARSSTASQDRHFASADRAAPSPPSAGGRASHLSSAGASPGHLGELRSPRRWTPAQSPVRLVSHVNAESEDPPLHDVSDDGDNWGGGSAGAPLVSSSHAPFSPPPRSALRVAEEVLRATRKSDVTEALPAEHPYDVVYGDHRDYHHNSRSALLDGGNGTEGAPPQKRWTQHRSGGPSVSFAESTLDDSSPAMRGSPPGRRDDWTRNSAFSSRADANGAPPHDEHEQRVWNKAVELLTRYSVS